MVPKSLSSVINSAGHHTVHHSKFNYNYGQYFTLWDRIGGSYYEPTGADLMVDTGAAVAAAANGGSKKLN